MNKTFKVVAKKINSRLCDYLTAGKVYEAYNVNQFKDVVYFNITNDDGDIVRARTKSCGHINDDWTIITEPAKLMPMWRWSMSNPEEVIKQENKSMNIFTALVGVFFIFGGVIGLALNHVYLPYDTINKCKLENALKENQKCELYYRVVGVE